MTILKSYLRSKKANTPTLKLPGLVAVLGALCLTAVSCSGGGSATSSPSSEKSPSAARASLYDDSTELYPDETEGISETELEDMSEGGEEAASWYDYLNTDGLSGRFDEFILDDAETAGKTSGSALVEEMEGVDLNVIYPEGYIPTTQLFGEDTSIWDPADLSLPEKNMDFLRARLQKLIDGYEGKWSVYVYSLSTDQEICINDMSMPSASELKLFILACVYDHIEKGLIERTSEVVSWMESMIVASSNDAANALIRLLGDGEYDRGIREINSYLRAQGYSVRTRAYNPFQNDNLIINDRHNNQTSARDCGELLKRVYHRDLGPRSVCNEIEQWMLSQQTRYKIPRGLPDGTSVGNKTGETDDVENDAAIVYTSGGDYILVILSCEWPDKKVAQEQFIPLSREVFNYFTDSEYIENIFLDRDE